MQYLEKSDLSKLFRAMYDAQTPTSRVHHLAAITQFFTGTRVSQLLNIRGEDIFEKDGKWVVLIRAAKRGDIVVRPLHLSADPAEDMSPLIELARVKGRSKIFGGLSRQYFGLALKKYAQVAGIHSTFAHSHIFRHSIAMIVFDATKRIGAVSQFLAHRSPSSAFVYLAENDNHLAQEAVDSLQLA